MLTKGNTSFLMEFTTVISFEIHVQTHRKNLTFRGNLFKIIR